MKSNKIKLLSSSEDNPRLEKGLLIPASYFSTNNNNSNNNSNNFTFWSLQLVTAVLGVFTFIMASVFGYVFMNNEVGLQASPIVTLIDAKNNNSVVLEYGEQPLLSDLSLFEDTQNSFIENEISFVSIDLANKRLRFFDKGVLLYDFMILNNAGEDTWRALKSGLYNVEIKNNKFISEVNKISYPWSILFHNNFIISGQPDLENRAENDFSSIELRAEDAEMLYKKIKKGTVILAYAQTETDKDDFYYKLTAPNLSTQNFIIADVENGSVLSAGSNQTVVPIASLTKLMTALVASEMLSLDGRIKIKSYNYATSLIPRLANKDSVSVYSLLQLLLKESSNEAADVIANEVGREDFINAMNEHAKQLEMNDTIFSDPSGLSADNISSPKDLLKLISYLYHNKKFIIDITAETEQQTSYTANEFSDLRNFNKPNGVDNFIGGKVGETRAAGHTSITLHKVMINDEERKLAVILLGTKKREEDIKNLIEYVKDRYG